MRVCVRVHACTLGLDTADVSSGTWHQTVLCPLLSLQCGVPRFLNDLHELFRTKGTLAVTEWLSPQPGELGCFGGVVSPRGRLTRLRLQDCTLRLWEYRHGRELHCCHLTSLQEPAEPWGDKVTPSVSGLWAAGGAPL